MSLGRFEDVGTHGDVQFQLLRPATPAERVRQRRTLEGLASRLRPSAIELRELVRHHDPVQLIALIATPAGVAIGRSDELLDDALWTRSWEAKIQYLGGLALSAPPGQAAVDRSITEAAVELLGVVFDGAHAELALRAWEEDGRASDALDRASFLLREEHLVDRVAGYVAHLERIDDEVFEPHRGFYVSALGFCPSDLVRLVRRRIRALNTDFERTLQELKATEGTSHSKQADAARNRLADLLTLGRVWDASETAARVEMPEDDVAAMLALLSTTFDSQQTFLLPGDPNRLRTHPLIALDAGRYLVPSPWSIAHAVHDWISLTITDERYQHLNQPYRRHRASAHERLVAELIAGVFEAPATLRAQHYDFAGTHGEVDCLVVGVRPLVIEAKASTLTASARRGSRQRIDRVADDIINRGIEQTARASSYIASGGRSFSSSQKGRPIKVLPDEICETVAILVTFERMDPVALTAPGLADGPTHPVWVTCLADLCMVVEILDHPGLLLGYALQRAAIASEGIDVYSESNALGAFLQDGLDAARSVVRGKGERLVIEYFAAPINDFYARLEGGVRSKKPSGIVPEPILQGLQGTYDPMSRYWHDAAHATVCASPATWRKWARFTRRHRERLPFRLPGSNIYIEATRSGEVQIKPGPPTTLVVVVPL